MAIQELTMWTRPMEARFASPLGSIAVRMITMVIFFGWTGRPHWAPRVDMVPRGWMQVHAQGSPIGCLGGGVVQEDTLPSQLGHLVPIERCGWDVRLVIGGKLCSGLAVRWKWKQQPIPSPSPVWGSIGSQAHTQTHVCPKAVPSDHRPSGPAQAPGTGTGRHAGATSGGRSLEAAVGCAASNVAEHAASPPGSRAFPASGVGLSAIPPRQGDRFLWCGPSQCRDPWRMRCPPPHLFSHASQRGGRI